MAWHEYRRVWIETRTRDGRPDYAVRWIDETGRKRFRRTGGDRRKAENERRAAEARLNAGELQRSEPLPLGRLKARHREMMAHTLQPTTLADQDRALHTLAETLGPNTLCDDVTERMAAQYLAARARDVAPATVNKNLRTLRAVFDRAVAWGYARANPFANARKLREPQREPRTLPENRVPDLLAACPDARWLAFCLLGLTAGLRLGEIVHLQWEDVDLERGALIVRSQTSWRTKTGRNRRLPLARPLADALRTIRPRDAEGAVLRTPDGKPWANNVQRDFAAICRRAGLGHHSPHDLRRTFCSALAAANVNATVVQRLAGHASPAVTADYYTRILDETTAAAVDALPWAATPLPPRPCADPAAREEDAATRWPTTA